MIFWDKKAKRFRSETGQFISPVTVRQNIEKMLLEVRRRSGLLAQQISSGEISLDEWQTAMRELLSAAHTLAGAIGKGGRDQMTFSDWGKIGATLKDEYKYLNRFAKIIEKGQVLGEDAIASRANLYVNAVRITYTDNEMQSARSGDFEQAMRILNAKESCDECTEYADEWLDVDEMPELGTLECGQYCLCTMEFRTASASE